MLNLTPEKKVKVIHTIKIVLLVFVVMLVIGCFRESDNKNSNQPEDVISFSGHGEVSAVPDIANIDFTISKDAKTVKEAQGEVAKIEKSVLEFLKTSNVADKDVKATNASFYPKYQEVAVNSNLCTQYGCPPSNSVIVGYTASESISVKIRNIDDVGKITEGIGALGVSNLNGPNFAIDKEDSFKDSARKLAIDDAKAKAKVLAKDLGVRLGKITSFSENGNYPTPMYASAMMDKAVVSTSAPAVVPAGENLITSDVTITYKLR